MDNEEWQEFVEFLVAAKRCSRNAWQILDGIDGTGPGVEQALNASLASIDAMYAIEHQHAFNQDVASPVAVQDFWDEHGELPGSPSGAER